MLIVKVLGTPNIIFTLKSEVAFTEEMRLLHENDR